LRRLDEADDNAAFGAALGYPPCCTQSFAEGMIEPAFTRDPVLNRYEDERPISWYLNVSLVCFQLGLLAHFPCSPACEPSLGLAAELFKALYNISPSFATGLSLGLATWVLHTDWLGIAGFRCTGSGQTVSVQEVLAIDQDSDLARLLLPGVVIERGEKTIRIGEIEIPAGHARLFRFL